MNTTDELEDLIDEALDAMWGPRLAAHLDKALALAIEQGDEPGEYRVRLLIGNNAQMSGDTDKLLSNFAWCLARHDGDPVRFPIEPDEGSDLMWQFKWMAEVLGADPQFSTEQIHGVLDDMEGHYLRANLGLSGVAMARFESAFQNGHVDEARAAYARLASIERDEHSHCDACVRSVSMGYHFSTGDTQQGIKEFGEIMDGGFTCGEEPENAMSLALVPLLRAGGSDNLASMHMRSYREARGNADNIGIIANHIAFCAITGNPARGLSLAERHLAWLAHDPLSHRSHLNFLSALGLLLEKAIAAGHGTVPVRGSDSAMLNQFFGRRDGVLSAAELAPLCWAASDALAADFDARNGNGWHAQLVADRRKMVGESHDLPLGAEAFNSVTPRVVAEPDTSDGWHLRTLDLAAVGQYDAALAACANGVRLGPDPRGLAALHHAAIRIHAQMPGEEHAAALRGAVGSRAAAQRDAGDEALAGLTERTCELLAGPEDAENNAEKLALISRELQAMESHPEALYILNAERAHILMLNGDHGQARSALEAMGAAIAAWETGDAPQATLRRAHAVHSSLMFRLCSEEDDVDGAMAWVEKNLELETSDAHRAAALDLRSRLRAQRGELAQALADAEAATDYLLGLGAREGVARAAQLSAAILQEMGRTEEARARLRFGIQQAQMAESPMVVALAYALAQDVLEHGSPDEAIELLDEAVGNASIEIGDHDRGELYELMGAAMRTAGEPGGALSAWTLGIESFEANGEPVRAAQLHLAASSTYQEAGYLEPAAGEARTALEVLLAAADSGEHDVDPRSVVAARMQLAEAMSLGGVDGAHEAIAAAAALAREADSAHQEAEIQLINARHLFRSGDVDAAVASALQGSSTFERVQGAEQQTVWALLQAAHLLDNAKRHDDAVALYKQVLDALAGDRQGQETVRYQLADCLEAGGRGAEAAAVRADA
ncbi:hypothetical protein AAGW05_02855 [Arthrobacter sp. LAPM80]|uniref:tetratricopeptide repeat protein n=1 Tax=Arthrobacter sp. LAPM80 TaxID=3141788 RepID=UPI00398A8293